MAAYAGASEVLVSPAFSLGYELARGEKEPRNIILRIEGSSAKDHLNGCGKSEAFPEFLRHVRAFYNNILEINHCTITGVLSKK